MKVSPDEISFECDFSDNFLANKPLEHLEEVRDCAAAAGPVAVAVGQRTLRGFDVKHVEQYVKKCACRIACACSVAAKTNNNASGNKNDDDAAAKEASAPAAKKQRGGKNNTKAPAAANVDAAQDVKITTDDAELAKKYYDDNTAKCTPQTSDARKLTPEQQKEKQLRRRRRKRNRGAAAAPAATPAAPMQRHDSVAHLIVPAETRCSNPKCKTPEQPLARWRNDVICYSCAKKKQQRPAAAKQQQQQSSSSSSSSAASAAAAAIEHRPKDSNSKRRKRKRYVSARDRLVHTAAGDVRCIARYSRGAVADEFAMCKRRMRHRRDQIDGDVSRFFAGYYPKGSRPLPELLLGHKVAVRQKLTFLERKRYREKRKKKHDAWLEKHTPQERIHRVLQCNTCGVVRHRDQHSCDNMLLLVLYALIKGEFTARPPYLARAKQTPP